jgi:hypothetical protein
MARSQNHLIAGVRDARLPLVERERLPAGPVEQRAVDRWMALLCLLVIVAIWPLCATVWLIEWTFVRFMTRAPRESQS